MTTKPTVEPEYDADTCLHAGELRDMGVENIPDDIPDCAWVPWSDVTVTFEAGKPDPNGLRLNMTVRYDIDAPWRWVEGVVYERDTNGTD